MKSTTLVNALPKRHGHSRFVVYTILLVVLAGLFSQTVSAQVPETDNFNGAEGPGWTLYAPFGGSKTISNDAFRIQSNASPSPETFGPARVAASRTTSYTDFLVAVDLIDWRTAFDPPSAQAFGILARATTPGVSSTDGYALTYSTNGAGSLDITIVSNEAPGQNLGTVGNLGLNPANDYRLVFRGQGTTLVGEIYDLANLAAPLGRIEANDATYASGINALFAYNQGVTAASTGPADVTFDNYLAVPEPASLGLVALALPLLSRRRK